jgi:hypothetical protein
MEDKVYTQDELRAENIITIDYTLNLKPGNFVAVLDMKAEAQKCLRVFFTFADGRKVTAAWRLARRWGWRPCPSSSAA